jgi:hypothetical protein
MVKVFGKWDDDGTGRGGNSVSADCRRTELLISRAMEEGLSSGERGRMEAHVRSCSACRETMAEFQALEYLLDGLPARSIDPPPHLVQMVMSRLPSHMEPGWYSSLGSRMIRPAAVAASIIVAIVLGYLGRDLIPSSRVRGPEPQSIHIIFYSPEAGSVALVGDFNDWGQRPVTMSHAKDRGMWEFSLRLPPGVYHYNLLVDGERWAANPQSSTLVPDGFGGYDSVLVVSEKCQNDCT